MMDVYEEDDGWPGLINTLFGALTVCRYELKNPAVEKLLDAALTEAENQFCRADRSGYREWAEAITAANGFTWEPCDAWYEGEFTDEEYAWIDQTEATES